MSLTITQVVFQIWRDGEVLGYRLTKGLFDFLLSLSLFALLLTPSLLVAVLIKLDSRGPVFFLTKRIGLGGKPFQMVKFRSMVDGAHLNYNKLREVNSESLNGVLFKLSDDQRITRFGKFLRVSSIDEIPQLWNVLRGDMSLVGPRPLHHVEIDAMDEQSRRRLTVKPGITGLWQVSGRSLLPFKEAIELDIHYVENASLWLDLQILLKTIPAVLSRRGAF